MSEASAQYVEPQELRMLRNALACTAADLEGIIFSLELSARNAREALQRTRMNEAWVAAVECTIRQEQRS